MTRKGSLFQKALLLSEGSFWPLLLQILSVVSRVSCCPYLKLKRLIKQWVVLVLSSGASPLFSAVCWHAVQLQNHVWINNLPLRA